MFIVVFILLLGTAPSRAALLPITLDPNGPNIQGFFGILSYDSGKGEFQSQTIPLVLSSLSLPDNSDYFDLTGTTTIDLFVKADGSFNGSGTGLSISGGNLSFSDGTTVSDPFLTGTITAFGAEPAGPPSLNFDGLFQVTGGSLTAPITLTGGGSIPALFSVGQTAGFFVTAEDVTSGTFGDFGSSFSSDSVKDQEGVLVPEPATMTLALTGTIFVLGWVVATSRYGHPAHTRPIQPQTSPWAPRNNPLAENRRQHRRFADRNGQF